MNEIVTPRVETGLPWGLVILLAYRVPRLVAGANRIMAARGRVFRSRKAEAFKEHIYASTLKLIGDLKRDPALVAIRFPIAGEECHLRVDVAFGFSQVGRGPARMISSDRDNLAKMFYDGLEGALIDDDKWITEGYIAKGQAPPNIGSDEMIYATVSRAGFRDPKHLYALTTLGVLPPWGAKREPSRIIRPGIHIQ